MVITDFEILQLLKKDSKLTFESAQKIICMNKYEEARKIHEETCNWAITPPSKEGGRWQTYVRDDSKKNGRRKIAKPSEEKLLEELVVHYLQKERVENMTLALFYEEWFEYKKSKTASDNTVKRHDHHWKKYYVGTELIDIKFKNLNSLLLEEWANNVIRKHDMTAKEFSNMKIIITDALKLAKRKGLIENNPWLEVEINKRLFRVVHKKSSGTQVYLNDELPKLYKVAKKELGEKPENTNAIAILLNLCLGLRISELVALKEIDIEGDYISIRRMEIRVSKRLQNSDWKMSGYEIVEYTKTREKDDRLLYLTNEARELIRMAISVKEKYGYESEYLFCNKRGRTTSGSISKTIKNYCKYIGIPLKSSHKIRKTVASRLNATGVPLDEIRKILGHTELATTLTYIYNPYNTEETEKRIENALPLGLDLANQ